MEKIGLMVPGRSFVSLLYDDEIAAVQQYVHEISHEDALLACLWVSLQEFTRPLGALID